MLLFTDCYLHFAALKPHYLPLRKRVGSMSETGSSSPLRLWLSRSLTAFGTRDLSGSFVGVSEAREAPFEVIGLVAASWPRNSFTD